MRGRARTGAAAASVHRAMAATSADRTREMRAHFHRLDDSDSGGELEVEEGARVESRFHAGSGGSKGGEMK